MAFQRSNARSRNWAGSQSADEELTDASDMDDNELLGAGEVCAGCGKVIKPGQPVRRHANGQLQHESC
jgi:hypothetical protein